MASVSDTGRPHITPIGFIYLRSPSLAVYFEQYTTKMPGHFADNPNVCIMAVNSGFLFWFRSLMKGRFSAAPGIRLNGTAGQRRKATPEEIRLYQESVRSTRRFKGHKLIWDGLETVREVHLESFDPVGYPGMTDHLWPAKK